MSLRDLNYPKLVTFFAIAFGIGVGGCGLNIVLLSLGVGQGHGSGDYFGGPVLSTLGVVELVVIVVSAICLTITVILWIVVAAMGNVSPQGHGADSLSITAERHLPEGSESEDRKDER